MAHPITIPKLGLTMVDCTLIEWAKQDGEKVSIGDPLYTVETDKIASEIEADAEGYLQRVAGIDSVHEVGAVVGYLRETKEEAAGGVVPDATPGPRDVDAQPAGMTCSVGDTPDREAAQAFTTLRADMENGARVLISPVARRIADENGLGLADLAGHGSGPGGAILKRDVEGRLERRSQRAAIPVAASATAVTSSSRPLAGIRRTIANRMMESLQGSAQMTAFGRVDMGEVVRLRAEFVAREQELGVRVTYTDIVIKAVATILSHMPGINAAIIDDKIMEWADANIGIAVALDDGLVVPVVHRADSMSIIEIARRRGELVHKARNGALEPADLAGGTFSVSNFGTYGGEFETPILNPPQSALLGIGQIADEAAVRDGEIVIRPMMMLSMTFDHRLIDGAEAGRFRAKLKTWLENPAAQMAEMR